MIDKCSQCLVNLKEKDKEVKEFDEFIEELFLAQKLSENLKKEKEK